MLNDHQDEEHLKASGFTEEMIEDQRWAREAPVDGLNSKWATSSGELFFDSFPDRLNSARRSVKNADAYFERRRREEEAKDTTDGVANDDRR